MGKCLFMRKGETHTSPSVYIGDPVFANNDWATIIEACQKNKVHPTWEIGDSKTMKINGTDYTIDIIGKNHDVYSDGSGTAPLTFQMHNCYGTTYAMNGSNTNSGGWSACAMRNTHLSAILTLMPSEIQTGIKEVNKLSSAGGKSSTINTTADKLFLLSEVEIFGTIKYSYTGEGSQYAYYAAGNSVIKSGGSNLWWERSPSNYDNQCYCMVGSSGEMGGAGPQATYQRGVAFAFCF